MTKLSDIKPTDRREVKMMVQQMYHICNKPEPTINFYSNPSEFKENYRFNTFDKTLFFSKRYPLSGSPSGNSIFNIKLFNIIFSIFGRDFFINEKGNSFVYCYKDPTLKEKFASEISSRVTLVIFKQDNVYIMDHPEYIEVDNDGAIHCENGPSVEFKDGYKLAHWHGQEIPLSWAMGNLPTPAQALQWKNMDQRSAACEMIGWNIILDSLKSKIIDDSGDPIWGTLLEVSIPGSGKERFLKVKCGTGRDFALPVPRDITTVDEAQSALHGGLPVEILKFSVKRT